MDKTSSAKWLFNLAEEGGMRMAAWILKLHYLENRNQAPVLQDLLEELSEEVVEPLSLNAFISRGVAAWKLAFLRRTGCSTPEAKWNCSRICSPGAWAMIWWTDCASADGLLWTVEEAGGGSSTKQVLAALCVPLPPWAVSVSCSEPVQKVGSISTAITATIFSVGSRRS